MSVVVCLTRCWSCMFGQHPDPPGPHPWADEEDIAYARATGKPDPEGLCGCHCGRPLLDG